MVRAWDDFLKQVVAISNGGPPGVIYELYVHASLIKIRKWSPLIVYRIAVSGFYWLIAASIAELASAMPSAGGGSSTEAYFLHSSFSRHLKELQVDVCS